MLACKLLNALITLSAALLVSAETTPFPCVLSNNLMMRGEPPTISIKSLVSRGDFAKPVTGICIPFFENN